MTIRNLTTLVNERVFLLIVVLITCGSLWGAYRFYQEGKILDQKIAVKQNELARILQLKEIYLANQHRVEKINLKKDNQRAFSLSNMEDMIGKTFVGGKLVMLKPSTFKEQKSAGQPSIEARVDGAALLETVTFLQKVETSGMFIKKLNILVPQNQPSVDMYVVITER